MADPRTAKPLGEWLLTAPSLLWLVALVLLPTLIVVGIAFRPADPFGGVGPGWTLDTLSSLAQPRYLGIAWRTLWISLLTTAVCVAVALPVGYCLARARPRLRRVLLLAVVVPFWVSFLIRVFAWKVLLHPDGLLKRALAAVNLVDADAILLYTPGAVLLVMVYSYLPFAILPLYAAAERFDFELVEAARDLGAGWWTVTWRILLPLLAPGVAAGALLAFTLSVDDFVVTFFVAGPGATTLPMRIYGMIKHGSLPLVNALSTVLLVVTFVAVWLSQRLTEDRP